MKSQGKEKKSSPKGSLCGIPHNILFQYLNNPYESLIIIDDEGKIVFMSQSFEAYCSFSAKDAIGQPVKKVFPKEEVTNVLVTGRAEIGYAYLYSGKPCISARIPIVEKGKVLGAVTKVLFWHADKMNELYQTINGLKGKLKRYEIELNRIYMSRYSFQNILGESPLITRAKELAQETAKTDSPALLIGESGTGKELFAHAIHRASRRKTGPFVRINCSSIPTELIEAELFGYEPGSFTGADRKGRIGKFERANEGTIFLDEIGDMPLHLQAKLLRVLEENEIEKIGGPPKQVDFRSIFATNRDIEKMIEAKEFRLDLYYRMNVMKITLPALRNIKEDIPLYVNSFIHSLKREMPKKVDSISPEAMDCLIKYQWPGNIRELRNAIERALITCKGNCIEVGDLPENIIRGFAGVPLPANRSQLLKDKLAAAEKRIIVDTLKRAGENRTEAARILGIHRTGLHKKLKQHGLD